MAEAATIARPYAKAAFMAARDEKALADWSRALQTGAALVLDPTLVQLLRSPKLRLDQLVATFAGLGGDGIDAHWQNFVRLLAINKRLEELPSIAAQYELLREQFENEMEVQVTSAATLSEPQQAALSDSLRKRFKRNVRVSMAVDPALLGGAVIRAGDLVIDGSIKGRLERMASELGN